MKDMDVKVFGVVVACGLALAASADSVTCVWTGGGDGSSWSNAANWQDERKPTSGDAVSITIDSGTIDNDIEGLTLSSLQMTATGKLSFGTKTKFGKPIVLTGDSFIKSTGDAVDCFTPVTLSEGVKFEFNCAKAGIWNADLSGSGDFYKRGAGSFTIQNCDNSQYSGTWYLRQGTANVYALPNAFGTGEVNVYGQDKSGHESGETTGSGVAFRRNVDGKGNKIRFANNFHFFYHVTMNSYRGIELDGDILHSSYDAGEDLRLAPVTENVKDGEPFYGYINLNGSVRADPNAHAGQITIYTSDIRHAVRFAGPEVDLQDKVFGYNSNGTIYYGSPIKTTSTSGYLVYGTYERTYVFERENVLPAGCLLQIGHTKQNSKFKVDLNGYNQRAGQVQFSQPNEGVSCSGELTSERAPATLSLHDPRPTSSRYWCSVNGQLSVEYVEDPDYPEREGTKSFYFNEPCNTTGRIASKAHVQVYLNAAFPNLSEIEITGRGYVLMTKDSETSHLKTVLNIHDLDPEAIDETGLRTAGYFHAGDAQTFTFGRVMFDDVDQEAGLYRRQKAGASAIYHAPVWLQSGTGYIEIPEHDMRWVWTGNGDGTSVSDAANWATNVAPDLASGHTILDFKYAKGSTEFDIDTAWNIAGLMTEADGALYTFGGNGSLTIGGTENCLANAKLTDALAVTYAGTGRQTFAKGVSDTTGTLTVSSGTLALADGASLTGAADVSIAASAKLDLADGVMAKANTLELDGNAARRGVWGSSGSSAARVDDAHFSGLGTLEALRSNLGMLLLFR